MSTTAAVVVVKVFSLTLWLNVLKNDTPGVAVVTTGTFVIEGGLEGGGAGAAFPTCGPGGFGCRGLVWECEWEC